MSEVTVSFIVINTIGTSVGTFVNLFLCYVAIFYSPPIIKTYSIILINITLANAGACVTGFLLQERIIQDKKSLFYVSYGPCSLLGERFCFNVFGCLLHCHTHALWLVFLSFAYRYYVMIKREPSRLALQLSILIIYIPSLIQLLAMFSQEMDIEEIRNLLHEAYPEYNLTGLTVTGAVDSFQFAPLYTLIHMTVISTPISIGIHILKNKIVGLLQSRGVDLSSKTRNLHAQLLRTLRFQATVPLIYIFGVFCFFSSHFWSHPIIEFFTVIPPLLVPILTPFSCILYVTPYRHYVFRFISQKVHPKNSVQTTMSMVCVD
ncbi:hypothetical protein GCK72_013601 [Caenorhabditis remanei]|uniref:Uncharacterized protein n=1 Tax=Caenorhabditis remanei TaxID=31234 RepID=A0A6A5GRI1_CAERE|nr:hypothetical protein GCK72_013601 [Caenorhabditis remanei]KAF1757146.1 hypothetical protein GCK72_013601 [Caenorhabditis remanei]